MDGILYLLNKTGLALAEAEQQIAQLRQEIATLREQNAGGQPSEPTAP